MLLGGLICLTCAAAIWFTGSRFVEVAGESLEVDAAEAPGGSWSLLVAGRAHDALIVQKKPGRFEVRISDRDGSQDFTLQAVEAS